MKPIVILVLLLCLRSTLVFGQVKIGNNPQNIDLSSVLELESNTKVLVITRITNLEMEAIIPQRGGVVYNTDTQCLHYFNGTEWINLCDAVSFSLTNEAIENITSTINIVDNGDTINLEVAPNSIRSENIIDGGINGNDIQNNSIGNDQLGGDSVGASELRDNSVGTSELIDRSIEASDMANSFPNQVLTTDVNGIVNWSEASDLQVAVTDSISIIGIGTLEEPLSIAPIFQTTVSNNTAAIVDETIRATAAEQANAIAITAEETRALTAEVANTDAIAAETLRATIVEQANANAIAAEETRALTAELVNTDAIAAETLRATTAETQNATDIANHISTDDDTDDQNEIQNLSSVLTEGRDAGGTVITGLGTPVAATDAVTKAYVDSQVGGVTTDDDISAVDFDGINLNVTESGITLSADLSNLEETADILTVQADVDLNEIDADAAIVAVQADVNLNETDADAAIGLKEDSANKSTDVTLADATNTLYPTELAVKTYVNSQVGTIIMDDDISEVDFDGTNLNITESGTTLSADLSDLEETADILTVQADVDLNEVDADAAIVAVQADVDLNETDADAAIALKEDNVNKSTDVTLADATNTLFPTELAVKTYVDTQIGAVTAGDNVANTDLTLDADRTHDLAGFNLIIEGTGNIGIGNLAGAPQNKLHVAGEVRSAGYSNSNGTPGEPAYSFTNDTNTGMFRGVSGGGNAPANWLRFATDGTEAITIDSNQKVGIGINPATNTKLHVNGNIRVEGTIEASGTINESIPDYVFQKYFTGTSTLNNSYEFQNLKGIEAFIKQNNHLPGIKSAEYIKEQGFWDLGEASRINLEKIEELFLHTIEQEKKIKSLENTNSVLANEVALLIAQMKEIKKMLTAKNNH
jgi:hypothetical protein